MNRRFTGDNSPREQYNVTPHNNQTQASFGQIPFSLEEFNSTKRTLSMQLGPEFVSTRAAFGGTRVAYLEGWKSINLANEMFGFNGWSSTIIDYTVDYLDVTDTGRVSLGMSCIMRVTLKDGTYHEDVGYGNIDNAKSKSQAFEKVKKEAATDALKRALRTFGNSLGNCLYDKNFLKQISRFKPPIAKPLELESLYHHDSIKREAEKRDLASRSAPQPNVPTPTRMMEDKDTPIKQEPVQSENFGFEDSDELFAQMADTYEFFANRSSEVEIPGQIERETVTTEVIPSNKHPVAFASTNTPESIRKRSEPYLKETGHLEGTSSHMCTPHQARTGVKDINKTTINPGAHKQCATPPSTMVSVPTTSTKPTAQSMSPALPSNSNPRRLINMFNTSNGSHDGSGTDGECSSGDSSNSRTVSNKGLKRQNGAGAPLFRPPLHLPYTDRREIDMPSPGSNMVKKTRTDAHIQP